MEPSPVRQIDTPGALQHLAQESAVFVDVRDPASYAAAHIPGAQHVNDHNIEDFLETTPRTRAVIVYCYHGITSMGGAAYLQSKGFEEVYSLRGGFEGWRGGNPIESGASPRPRPYSPDSPGGSGSAGGSGTTPR